MTRIINFLISRDADGCFGFEAVLAYALIAAPFIGGILAKAYL